MDGNGNGMTYIAMFVTTWHLAHNSVHVSYQNKCSSKEIMVMSHAHDRMNIDAKTYAVRTFAEAVNRIVSLTNESRLASHPGFT